MPSAVMDATLLQNFLPPGLEFQCTRCEFDSNGIVVEGAFIASSAVCPECGQATERVHGHYRRRVRDLPFGKTTVTYLITARKFMCQNERCPKTIFCERLCGLATAHARTTDSLSQSHQSIGFALGGEGGARLAERLGMPTSPDTLLRRVRYAIDEPVPAPRFVGIDDWAYKKGKNYGTILIDLERRQVIDIFPGRDGEAVKDWLKANPQVEVITRDRWANYAQAASDAAPQAKQVADRWHLLKNLREAVERFLARFSPEIRTATEPSPAHLPEPVITAVAKLTSESETPIAGPLESGPMTKESSAQRRRVKRNGWSAKNDIAECVSCVSNNIPFARSLA